MIPVEFPLGRFSHTEALAALPVAPCSHRKRSPRMSPISYWTRSSARVAGAVALAATVGLVAAGCSTSSTASSAGTSGKTTSITLQTSWIPEVTFGGSYMAADKGYYKQEGLKVDIAAGGPDVDPTSQVAAGKAQIGISDAEAVAQANAKGADLVIVGAAFQSTPLAILSRASDPIKNPKGMEGRTIGVPTGDAAINQSLMKVNDLDTSKVKDVPASFDVAPLVSKKIDGLYAFYTEQPISLEEKGVKPYTFLLADYGLNYYGQVYFTTKTELADHRSTVESFMTAEVKGWQAASKDQAKVVDLTVNKYGKGTGLSKANQTEQAKRQQTLLVTPVSKKNGLLSLTKAGVTRNTTTLKTLGVESDSSLFDLSVLKDVYNGKSSL
jgi:ABC-type nitrate/sulfonate/bicarbonate transport system substrate-binding protein